MILPPRRFKIFTLFRRVCLALHKTWGIWLTHGTLAVIDATVLHEVEANTGLIKVIEKPKKISKLDDLTKSVSCARDALLYILSGKTKITKFDMKKRAVLIQYLVYLITLYRHARDSKRNTIKYPKPDSPLEPIPKSVVNAMLQDFSEPSANQPNNITVYVF
jgi:hypothetical protein